MAAVGLPAAIARTAKAFNDSKFMNVIDSYRDTAGARDLITRSIAQYRDLQVDGHGCEISICCF